MKQKEGKHVDSLCEVYSVQCIQYTVYRVKKDQRGLPCEKREGKDRPFT